MKICRKKPNVVETLTFDELMKIGRQFGRVDAQGMPLTFEYNGAQVIYQDGKTYLIPARRVMHEVRAGYMLVRDDMGNIVVCSPEEFAHNYHEDDCA